MFEEHSDYIEIELEEEPIELCNLLKVLDLAETGGQAKMLIGEGYVAVNDALCTVKRKKLYSGDTLSFDGESYRLTLAEGVEPAVRPAPADEPKEVQTAPTQRKKRNRSRKDKKDSNTGRKPISFG
ncbi:MULTISPECIES: RNA-binding S4 domain-containing protein [Pseudoalteromonas]|uniref:Ribosome-associated protein n=1 Tax=Pseudoalteromonas amylolytica TaxID=1859457 RepID=A0A1S1MRL5_9GAMM|nr:MULTISPECIES: RNA-binding S4 domain-containing protein [Pseudoalteromonas]OHU85963.1 ribosome-associated protein [Pseudoalteromonas sp. JW3]OHU89426.1 ribosome-associated protein [Pseudoalteromonas amylolytica]